MAVPSRSKRSSGKSCIIDDAAAVHQLAAHVDEHVGARNRFDEQLARTVPIHRAGMQRPDRTQAMVVGKIPREAARCVELRGDRVLKHHRTADRRDTVRAVPRLHEVLVLVEHARRRWRALVEEAETAPQHGAAGGVEQHRRANSRRDVDPPDDAVAVEAPAEFDEPPRIRLHAILNEQRHVGAVDRLRSRRTEVQPAHQCAVGAPDQDGRAGAVP